MYSTLNQQHLAWHETMEMHELVAFQANHLIGFKMNISAVSDPQLRSLYEVAIQSLEQNLQEFLHYYPSAPIVERNSLGQDMTAYYAGHLLLFAKTAVRNYAIAITESATPQLRETLQKHLNHAIKLHGNIFYFMYERGLYPSYQLDKLLATDLKNAHKALNL